MAKYIINGGNKLSGQVLISGNKNGALPCLAACLLTQEEVVLHNLPQISDVQSSIKILEDLGAQIVNEGSTVRITCKNISHSDLPEGLANKLRASILFVGPLLARFGEVEFPHPGGCVIGKRGIDIHLEALKQLGYQPQSDNYKYRLTKTSTPPSQVSIFLEYIATVTGTGNIILASVTRPGATTIRNAAQEPHVVDLCNLLVGMGAKIEGIGTNTLNIEGVEELHGTEFTICPDNIEFGTYAIAAAITGGEIELLNCPNLDIEPMIWPMRKMGMVIEKKDGLFSVKAREIEAIPKLVTNTWPGFPTDLLSAMIVLATQAKGVSLLHDWIFESRMFFVDKLITMGADITIADPHRVIVSGPTPLYGKKLESPDIRAGMALVLAALAAQGESIIDRAELIERGYEDVLGKLTPLGAKIQKID